MGEAEQTPTADNDDPRVTHREYDWSSVAPSTAVLETLADAADCEPTALNPLYETVDPDALNRFVRSSTSREYDGFTTVTFVHDDYEVTAHNTGIIIVRPAGDDE